MRLLALLLLVGCAPKTYHTYDNSLFELAAGFAAKEMCSCVFIAEQPEDVCDEWTRVSPNVATHHIDWEEKTVRTRALAMNRTYAQYTGEETGCVIVQ